MSQNVEVVASSASARPEHSGEHAGKKLGAFLCWAVVFADIGTSVYYTPGILYGQVGPLAGLFVTMTLGVFLLLTLKYAEVSVRFPEGGGVVTVAARGLNPWAGAVGGMFILVDYFLTSAISSLSGVQYFETIFPGLSSIVLQLVITLILIALLGLLNWYGIRESAVVSAGIAVVAFISDILILILVFAKVPLHVIGEVFQAITNGENLTVPLVLTGFAGAFLAFSGLESISQLSPVMRTPRHKTVTAALTIVVITVAVTSPLLTIFSTVLLTHPHLLAQTSLFPPQVTNLTSLENQFISQLGFAAGGRLLEILTAITASTLLVFASNTAIIGAYHVFLALSGMKFFPNIVRKRNKMRDTPHISIALATIIPMAVLIAVGGRIDLLGDMYAFGLLGAFSLTCIALDVIRWRERHNKVPLDEHLYGAEEVEDVPGMPTPRERVAALMRQRLPAESWDRLVTLGGSVATTRAALARYASPAAERARALWPSVKYYLGILTTILVVIAWAVNLKTKPLATVFGGGLTVLGVAIAVWQYRRQPRELPIFNVISNLRDLRPIPNSRLVVLGSSTKNNQEVIRGACQSANGHALVFLYLAEPQARAVRPFEIDVPYLADEEAQHVLTQAASICAEEHRSAYYVYQNTPGAIVNVWRIIQPDEIIAEAETAKKLAQKVTPDYVRIQQVDGVRVVHSVKRYVSALQETSSPAVGGTVSVAGEATTPNGRPAPRSATGGTVTPQKPTRPPSRSATPTGAAPGEARSDVESEGMSAGNLNLDDYVWTGTDYVRRDELPAEATTSDDGADEAADERAATPNDEQ
ncbi:MAG: putative amino acid permease, GabP family [Ktedonobacterales bacterium]|nr:MAG: putative amino acid permease, GabP family [Ktedonobacterales bacterium]